jgi:hypothetical protein
MHVLQGTWSLVWTNHESARLFSPRAFPHLNGRLAKVSKIQQSFDMSHMKVWHTAILEPLETSRYTEEEEDVLEYSGTCTVHPHDEKLISLSFTHINGKQISIPLSFQTRHVVLNERSRIVRGDKGCLSYLKKDFLSLGGKGTA